MKKLLPIILLVLVAASAWYFSSQRASAPANSAGSAVSAAASSEQSSSASAATEPGAAIPPATGNLADLHDHEGTMDIEVQPAARAYKSAEEALEAVKKGAADYNDSILEQFTLPGEDCAWCPQFYKDLRELISGKTIPVEQLSYFGEIMAISGRAENIQALVDGIKNPTSEEHAQALSEALELTIGNDQIVGFLSEQLAPGGDDRLRESSIAAITNQGSRLAAEVLYKTTVEQGDPDGFYSKGTGLGELVPGDEAMPYVQELLNKRDKYSHLAAKALANAGLPGLKMVFDSLSTSKDLEGDRQILKDLINHLNYDEDIENYLKAQAESQNQPALREFAQKSLEAMQAATAEDTSDAGADGGDQMQTPLNPE